ncbi:hypothetical protein GUJ93_ZPchr0011g28014 [Zizania palustris]|uniref:Uncharacterized protein n=1 Tax=Zizania palustris TaxID=103762 RepID=A0A8J5WLF1_ZIZPA|nr:hypothetical protein GUJ93_ZPchr0011g28014 [Zizania palustris]
MMPYVLAAYAGACSTGPQTPLSNARSHSCCLCACTEVARSIVCRVDRAAGTYAYPLEAAAHAPLLSSRATATRIATLNRTKANVSPTKDKGWRWP